jgi:hypothetical protein
MAVHRAHKRAGGPVIPENEISDFQYRWRSGEYRSTPCLTVQPDGTLVLRPERPRGPGAGAPARRVPSRSR